MMLLVFSFETKFDAMLMIELLSPSAFAGPLTSTALTTLVPGAWATATAIPFPAGATSTIRNAPSNEPTIEALKLPGIQPREQ